MVDPTRMMGLLTFSLRLLIGWALLLRIRAADLLKVSISNVHANTLAGPDTQTGGKVLLPTLYSADIGSTFVYQLWTFPPINGPAIWLFSPTATSSNRRMGLLLASGLINARNSLLFKRTKLFVSCTGGEDRLQVHTLSYDASTNTYGQVSWAYHAMIKFAVKTISDDQPSNYVFYLDTELTPSNLRKWDTNLPNRDPAGVTMPSRDSESMQMSNNNIVVFGTTTTTGYWIERSAFTLLAIFSGPIETRGFTIDNLNPKVYFLTKKSGTFGISRILLGTSTYVQTHAIPPVAGQLTHELSNALNLGNMAYIGLIRYHETNLPFRIYAKADLVEIELAKYSPVAFPNWTSDNLMVAYAVDGKSTLVHFGLQVQVSGVYNFQSWRITLGPCETQTGWVCTSCPLGYYLDKVGVDDNTCIELRKGLNPITNRIVPCQDQYCSECAIDYTLCTKCWPGSLLYQNKCFQTATLPDGIGTDIATMTPVPCADANCVDCRANHENCLLCNRALHYFLDLKGVCQLENTTPLKVSSATYDFTQATASITFDADITVVGDQALLNFIYFDSATSTRYTCEQLNCVKQVQSRGVSVTFKTNLIVPERVIIFSSHPEVMVQRATDLRLFSDYPVLVTITPRPPPTVQIPSVLVKFPVTAAKSMQLPATLFFAAVQISLLPFFENVFTSITVMAFYPSPPITAFDTAILTLKNVTVLPFTMPNMFEWMLLTQECAPGQMLKRYQYSCRFLLNFGVQLTVVVFMLLFSLTIKSALYFSRKFSCKHSSSSVKPQKSNPASAEPKGQEQQTPPSDPASSSRVVESSEQAANSPKPNSSGLQKGLLWVDQHLGLLLLLSKLEGKQAEYLVYAFQDFWSNDGSSSKTISTVAAVLMMFYPAFSMVAIQSLVNLLCREYKIPRAFHSRARTTPTLESQVSGEESARKLVTGSGSDSLSTRDLTQSVRVIESSLIKAEVYLDLDANTALQQRYFYNWRFLFDGCLVPNSDLRMVLPAMSLLKNIVSAFLILSDGLSPRSQCLAGLLVEVCYLVYMWNYSVKKKCLEAFAERAITFCCACILVVKYFSHSADQEFLQTSVAIILLTIILVMMLVTALVTILSVVVWAVKLFRRIRLRKEGPRVSKSESGTFGNIAGLPEVDGQNEPNSKIQSRFPTSMAVVKKVAQSWIRLYRAKVLTGKTQMAKDFDTNFQPQKYDGGSDDKVLATNRPIISPRSSIKAQTLTKRSVPPVLARLSKQRLVPNPELEDASARPK